MSHFYAQIDRSTRKTNATARGSKKTGASAVVASWSGGIRTTLWHDEAAGVDRYTVEMVPWHGSGDYAVLAEGIVGQAPATAKAAA